MPPNRTVTVVIPTYGRKSLLEETLDSLAKQTYPAELTEVVVVDDCSEDDTYGFLQGLETPFRLVPVRHEVNQGRAAARNTALRAAGGDLVVFVDDDMRCDSELITEHVRFHDGHPGAGLIGSALQAPELGRSTIFTYLDAMGVHQLESGSRAPARYFVTNNASIARQALLDVGLFDENFRNYGFEDTEIAIRLEEEQGTEFWYSADALAWHIHYQTLDAVLDKREDTAEPLAYLLRLHPDRAVDFSVDSLLPASPDDPPSLRLRKLAARLATNRACYSAVRWLAGRVHLRGASLWTLRYLIACQYRVGLARLAGPDGSGGSARP
jgi:glycosyltransferase involved in cell wall biosynthesis